MASPACSSFDQPLWKGLSAAPYQYGWSSSPEKHTFCFPKTSGILRVGIAILMVVAFACLAPTAHSQSLRNVSKSIAQTYPDVPLISASELARKSAAGEAFVLLDVRSKAEFAVSHISGAVRIDPGASLEAVENAIGPIEPDDTIVLYCSVGYRSTRLAELLLKKLGPQRSPHLFSLEGGIFQWHNDARSLENEAGATLWVHPFNAARRELLRHQQLVSWVPRREE